MHGRTMIYMDKENYQNPLLKKDKLPMFQTGLVIRVAFIAALLGGAAFLGRDVIWGNNAEVEQTQEGGSQGGSGH